MTIVQILCYLYEIPVSSRLGDLVGDGATGCTEEDQLLGVEVNHVKEGFQADAGIALKTNDKIIFEKGLGESFKEIPRNIIFFF